MEDSIAKSGYSGAACSSVRGVRCSGVFLMSRSFLTIPFVLIFLALGLVLGSSKAVAIEGGVIRDAEIENILNRWAAPIVDAAGLDPDSVQIYIIDNTVLNAFVAGGQNIFFTTGLLMRAQSVGAITGVLAHEVGHIAGGHLVRTQGALKQAQWTSIIGTLIGAGAMIAAGGGQSGGAGMASLSGGQHIAERQFLHYSRSQESAADQAALNYLEKTGQSAQGLADFLKLVERQSMIADDDIVPYTTTHPLTKDRINVINHHLQTSAYALAEPSPSWVEDHARMRAKLVGFIEPFEWVLRRYPPENESIAAQYARTIAHYRRHDLETALPMMDSLLESEPENPYFHELKGQILFENGYLAEAAPSYRRAVELLPDHATIRVGLARALLGLNRSDLNKEAIATLSKALAQEKDNPTAWNLIGSAYGREGHKGLAALSLAEQFVLTGRKKEAARQAEKALKLIAEKTPSWYRARDILALVDSDQ